MKEKSEYNRKIIIIFSVCTALVIAVCIWTIVRSNYPTIGKPYERLEVEEARIYMSYENEYCIVDVREKEEYDRGHLDGALSLPYDSIVTRADEVIPGRGCMTYVYGESEELSCAAAQKLSDMGFTSITEIGSYDAWVRAMNEIQTEEELLKDAE